MAEFADELWRTKLFLTVDMPQMVNRNWMTVAMVSISRRALHRPLDRHDVEGVAAQRTIRRRA